MATAFAYDAWEDPGLAFTEREVEDYDPQKLAEARRDHLLSMWAVVHRHSELKIEAVQWWKDAARKVLDVASWYCVACEVPAFDRAELASSLPSPSSSAGKKLTAQALDLTPEAWLGDWSASSEACMRYAVTLGRRAIGKKRGKNLKRLSNKLANSIMKEMRTAQHLEELLSARTTKASG